MNTQDIEELMLHPRMHQLLDRYMDQRIEAMIVGVLKKRDHSPMADGMVRYKDAAAKYDLNINNIQLWVSRGCVIGKEGFVQEESMLEYVMTRAARATRQKVVSAIRRLAEEDATPQLRIAR